MGNPEKNTHPVKVYVPGVGVRGMWVVGRGHEPGAGPSLSPAGDGRPWTYHGCSPHIDAGVFEWHLGLARALDEGRWLEAAPPALADWLRALPADERTEAWVQARHISGYEQTP